MTVMRVGIVGLGFGALMHIPAFNSSAQTQVAAVADIFPGRARETAAKYRIPQHYESWEELVRNPGIDAVCVVTPPAAQREVVCGALAAGKHVFCEKPLGLTLAGALAMQQAAAASGRANVVDFEFRLDPGIMAVKRQVAAGAVGAVRRLDVSWFTGGRADPSRPWSWQHEAAAGGGVLYNWGSHIIDYLEWVAGSALLKVWSAAQVVVPVRKDAAGVARQVTAEDSCDMVGELANGAVVNLRFSNCHPGSPGHRFEVFGDQGYLVYSMERRFRQGLPKVTLENEQQGRHDLALEVAPEEAGLDLRSLACRRLAGLFIQACQGREDPALPDFGAGVRVNRVMEAVRQSWQSRSTVAVEAGAG